MTDFGLYIIMTNPVVGYERFLEACIEEQMPWVQLRDKELADSELLNLSRHLVQLCRGTHTSLIINDRPDIALLAGADGFHLGQEDLPVDDARIIIPPGRNLITGLSTHSPQQAKAALHCKPDYIGFGPVYPTPTKKKPDPAVGLSRIRQVVEESPVPVVVLGGLFPEHIEQVMEYGAKNICCVRYLNETEQPGSRIQEIKKMIGRMT